MVPPVDNFALLELLDGTSRVFAIKFLLYAPLLCQRFLFGELLRSLLLLLWLLRLLLRLVHG